MTAVVYNGAKYSFPFMTLQPSSAVILRFVCTATVSLRSRLWGGGPCKSLLLNYINVRMAAKSVALTEVAMRGF